jgi:hypothetical protein
MPALILTVMAAALLITPASPQDGVNLSRKDQLEQSAKKVKELQKERIATLKKMADQLTLQYKAAQATVEDAYEAKLLVLKAELDAAEKESDRITLYEQMVGVMKDYEKAADRIVKSGQAKETTFLKAKARRLEAEIKLEQATAKRLEAEIKGAKKTK